MITKQKKGYSNKIGEGNQVADLCLRLDYFAHMTSLHYFDNISASELIPLPKSWIRCSYLHFIFEPFTLILVLSGERQSPKFSNLWHLRNAKNIAIRIAKFKPHPFSEDFHLKMINIYIISYEEQTGLSGQ